jgi:hypothetical protein
MTKLLKNIAKDPGTYITLIVFVLIVAGAIYILATTSAANWRLAYCQASPEHAIECTEKGWR